MITYFLHHTFHTVGFSGMETNFIYNLKVRSLGYQMIKETLLSSISDIKLALEGLPSWYNFIEDENHKVDMESPLLLGTYTLSNQFPLTQYPTETIGSKL